MKPLIPVVLLLSSANLRVCGKDEGAANGANASASASALATAEAAGSAKAALTGPRIGGNVVAAGDFSVEVALHRSGEVEALVSDATGKLVSDAKLAVTAAAQGSAREKVELAFAGPRARFEGRAKAGVELASGPIEVALEVGGKAVSGKLELAVALPRPELGGHVLAAGDVSAEVLARTNGEVEAKLYDRAGAAIEGGVDCKVSLDTKAGGKADIALAFDPARASFVGRAAAGVELVPGRLEIRIGAGAGAGVSASASASAGASAKIGALASAALSASASHGGKIVMVGDYAVELVVNGKQVSAFVFDASGKAHVAGDLDLKLALGADLGTSLALKWDAPSLSYKGSIDADLDLAVQPIRIALTASGKAFVGAIASLRGKASADLAANAKLDADAKAKLDADAKLGAKAGIDAKLKAPDIKAKVDANAAKAANVAATAKVTPPKVNVSANKSASTGAKAGGGAKASAGFSFGSK